jgi:hypothetical protein
MKKALLSLPVLAGAALLAGCAGPDNYGGLYTSELVRPKIVTDNALGTLKGDATYSNIIGIVTNGKDAGVGEIAKKAKITKVGAVDVKVKNILGVYSETTYIVYGE